MIELFYKSNPVRITADSGATSSLIQHATVQRLSMPMTPATQRASLADGRTMLKTCGEVQIILHRGNNSFKLNALVVEELDVEILGGMPFLLQNNLVLDIPRGRIMMNNHAIPCIGPGTDLPATHLHTSRVLRLDTDCLILPNEVASFKVPGDFARESLVAIEPHCPKSISGMWPHPSVLPVEDGFVSIPNESSHPVVIRRDQHIATVRRTCTESPYPQSPSTSSSTRTKRPLQSGPFCQTIKIDPDNQLSQLEQEEFANLHLQYDSVFDDQIGKYNDAYGRLRANVNIGSVEPPQCKGHLPFYDEATMREMQDKMDELEDIGVLAKPDKVGISVEYVSPSFLVKKEDNSKRLVTSFIGIAAYAKAPPSRVTSVDSVLRFLAKWKYIIKSDMTKQFFQMALKRSCMKYLGVMTPYKGLRVYTRAAMGMPGSSEHLDELMFRVLGDLIHAGSVSKIADDLYIGSDTVSGLLDSWRAVLERFKSCNLRLSPTKTIICPRNCVILGWLWTAGRITPSAHKLNPLTTASPPTTVKGLRSWMGSVKYLKACLQSYSSLLSPLEAAAGGKDSKDRIEWTDQLRRCFTDAQAALRSAKTITIPRSTDQLVITVDAAQRNGGIGSVLYVLRDGDSHLGGYFSLKLKPHHQRWLPCEIEALAISSSLSHWSMYLAESENSTQVLTDSKPCVQAYAKLAQGQFSTSARVATFLSSLSRFRVTLQHIPGTQNLAADFLSRNSLDCEECECQICRFIQEQDVATVNAVSVTDILERRSPMPYLSPHAWKQVQQDCGDLRRVYAHLANGSRPQKRPASHRSRKESDLRKYLGIVTIGRDGLLVVKKNVPFAPNTQLIVVPRRILPGLLTALHLRLGHPSTHQLRKVFDRYYYALGLESSVKSVFQSCDHCVSLSTLPADLPTYTTSDPPTSPGAGFACDVMRRACQFVFVTRDVFSSYTTATLIPREDRDSFRNAILETTSDLRLESGAVIRVDAASALRGLISDRVLERHGLRLEIGRVKNVNKNPIAEKAIQELGVEIKKRHPDGAAITKTDLLQAVYQLNMRQRNRGMSAREIVFQRDAVTGSQLKLNDIELARAQYEIRADSHKASAKSKFPGAQYPREIYKTGDLVYVKSDGNKHAFRNRYIISYCEDDSVFARKLVGNQLRAQLYELKRSGIHKVPQASRDPPQSPVSDPVSVSSDSEPEDICLDGSNSLLDHSEYDLSESEDSLDSSDPPSPITDIPSADTGNRVLRPRASLRAPERFRSDDFVTDLDASD